MKEAMKQWADDVSKAYDILAFGNTERAAEILGKTRDAIRKSLAEQHLQALHDENVRLGLYEQGDPTVNQFNPDYDGVAMMYEEMKVMANRIEELEAFAKLVADKEREGLVRVIEANIADERAACAKVCDARYMGDNSREDMEAKRCAKAIRARGEA